MLDVTEPLKISGLADVADNYTGYIVDLWGVVHDGFKLFEGVIPCLEKLKALDKTVVFLSNAPRSSGVVIEQLSSFGMPRDLYEGVLTSGDMTLNFLRRFDAMEYFHIGLPDKDSSLRVGIGMNPAGRITDADIIIASNFEEDRPLISDYSDDFRDAIARGIPMVCANPDLVVYRGDSKILCSGALAAEYEKLGGVVHYFGKPYLATYEYLFKSFQSDRWLAIGDSYETDIMGANVAGIDSLLVLSGIHQDDAHHYINHEAKPRYMSHKLNWS